MDKFDKMLKERLNAIYGLPTSTEKIAKIADEEPKNDEWILVKGYKGTDKDMRCRGFQYELGKQYDMPEGSAIKECESGFHLCKELEDVFRYYEIDKGNRFFEVRAQVRKEDYSSDHSSLDPFSWSMFPKNKLIEVFIDVMKNVADQHRCTIEFETRSCDIDFMRVTIIDGTYKYTEDIRWSKANSFIQIGTTIWSNFFRFRGLEEFCRKIPPADHKHTVITHTMNPSRIKNVIFNPPATIVFWADGTKTVVKAQNEDEFDAEKGLAMAVSKKALGNQGNYFNTFTKWTASWEKEQAELDEKVDAIIKNIRENKDNVYDNAIRTVIETIKRDILGVE